MIIIEGPDGSGKSTLIEALQAQLGLSVAPRHSDSLQGPTVDLVKWIHHDLQTWVNDPIRIYDRYPLISEPIYGPILRGHVPEPFTEPWMYDHITQFHARAFMVWCLPPLSEVVENVRSKPEEQLQGVPAHISGIWSSYAVLAQTWMGRGVWYDYTRPNSMHAVVSVVEQTIQYHPSRSK